MDVPRERALSIRLDFGLLRAPSLAGSSRLATSPHAHVADGHARSPHSGSAGTCLDDRGSAVCTTCGHIGARAFRSKDLLPVSLSLRAQT